jgi:hypothetical protein
VPNLAQTHKKRVTVRQRPKRHTHHFCKQALMKTFDSFTVCTFVQCTYNYYSTVKPASPKEKQEGTCND